MRKIREFTAFEAAMAQHIINERSGERVALRAAVRERQRSWRCARGARASH
jgi:hypothetical protein